MRRILSSVQHHSRSSMVRGNRPNVNSRGGRLLAAGRLWATLKDENHESAEHEQNAEPYWNLNAERTLGWMSGCRLGSVEKRHTNSLPWRASPAARSGLRPRLRWILDKLVGLAGAERCCVRNAALHNYPELCALAPHNAGPTNWRSKSRQNRHLLTISKPFILPTSACSMHFLLQSFSGGLAVANAAPRHTILAILWRACRA